MPYKKYKMAVTIKFNELQKFCQIQLQLLKNYVNYGKI